MNPGRTLSTAARVLRQIRSDKRTIALMFGLPIVLIGLLAWVYADTGLFDQFGAALLGTFPLVVMFVVTSVAALRERTSGTLERLLSTPLGKADFILGYAVAFSLMAIVQGALVSWFAIVVCGLDVAGPTWLLVVVVMLSGLLGMALGLFASGFAQTEFQAVQFMPATVLPQFLLCGLLVPRDRMPAVLEAISNVLPLSYSVDAAKEVSVSADPAVASDFLIVGAWIIGALVLGSLTLRRRTP
ncbi:ABC transporter permease [Kribbia dieselivorans]|uniref:ABC transporter permease n=1 Tax=Kribbia dieselivorans TaxID=331526 RepID=UPI0008381001|nr:ABC transporter permease [Kribbia dieselivorans]